MALSSPRNNQLRICFYCDSEACKFSLPESVCLTLSAPRNQIWPFLKKYCSFGTFLVHSVRSNLNHLLTWADGPNPARYLSFSTSCTSADKTIGKTMRVGQGGGLTYKFLCTWFQLQSAYVCGDFFTVSVIYAHTSSCIMWDDFMPCLHIFLSDKCFVYRSITIGMISNTVMHMVRIMTEWHAHSFELWCRVHAHVPHRFQLFNIN